VIGNATTPVVLGKNKNLPLIHVSAAEPQFKKIPNTEEKRKQRTGKRQMERG
jgi:hypothetical protein